MKSRRTYRVKDVAEIAGVSVRTLHHYDDIGLLVPKRSEAGYRLYDDDDLLRLQQILVGRALGLSLEEVRRSIDDPRFDRVAALREQRRELERRRADATRMIAAVDAALEMLTREGEERDMKALFGGFDPSAYEDEAASRWGDTPQWAESMRRTKSYGPEQWAALKDEQGAIYADLAAALAAGADPGSPEVQAIALRHRASIDRWFYPCDAAMHTRLADLYENDPRFAANIDRFGAGLTAFLCAAIRAVRSSSS